MKAAVNRFFLITIDTEGDNLWSRPRRITTRNASYLPRFQTLCERFGMKPTWLTNYEMANCPEFQEFGRHVTGQRTAEIGMHLHAWNTPPLVPVTDDDYTHQPFLIEYSNHIQRQKVAVMSGLLRETFDTSVVTHRAGRWAIDEFYAQNLIDHGYVVDCSVTPAVNWRGVKGNPQGDGGCDYSNAPFTHYFAATTDITSPGDSPLLEVPMTTRPVLRTVAMRQATGMISKLPSRTLRRLGNRFWPDVRWLRPNGRNRKEMLGLLDETIEEGGLYAEFMLHSSELMPGGSPRFPNERETERLYEDIEAVFEAAASRFCGATMQEFHAVVVSGSHGAHSSNRRDKADMHFRNKRDAVDTL